MIQDIRWLMLQNDSTFKVLQFQNQDGDWRSVRVETANHEEMKQALVICQNIDSHVLNKVPLVSTNLEYSSIWSALKRSD